MVMPNLSLSAGGGGPSGSSSNATTGTPINTPFNFDGSGWVINFGSGNSTAANGNRDANQSAQATPAGLGGLLSGVNPTMLAVGVVLYLLLRKS